MENDFELYHHGVMGMKWGVRKRRPSSGSSSSSKRSKSKGRIAKVLSKRKAKKKAKEKKKKEKETEKKRVSKYNEEFNKDVRKLTNKQLQNRIDRLQLEAKYASLNHTKVSEGKKILNTAMKTAGQQLATEAFKYVGGNVINEIVGDKVVNVSSFKDSRKKKVNG